MLRASHMLQLTVMAMLAFAVVMVHSAAMTVGDGRDFTLWTMLSSRHAIYAAVAIAAMLGASRLDVRQLRRVRGLRNPMWWLLALSLVMVVLAMAPQLGRAMHGARRWLYLGPPRWGISFQPSELVKWLMVLAIAWWCARRGGAMRRFGAGLAPPILLTALACGLIMIEDLGTAALIGLVAMLMLIAGGARLWHLAVMAAPAAAALAWAIIAAPFRLQRLAAFINPWADPQGTGYHPIQSMLAIAGGGLTGRGLGGGIQKFGYLPEDTNDFIFAVICEELGVGGAALVIVLLLTLLWTGMTVLRRCPDSFGRLVILGILLTLGLQALINIAVVTVVVPTKGIALPLIGAGGTGWILTAASLGLIAALDEANRMEPAQVDGILLNDAV